MKSTATTAREIWSAVRRAAFCRKTAAVARGRATMRDQMAAALRGLRRPERNMALLDRLANRLVATYSEVIAARGGETTIEEKDRSIQLSVISRDGGLTLLRAEGWRHYSNRFGARKAAIAYICGRDDNGRWAARVPATCETVAEALDAITPAAVKAALAAGKRVLRQGDVYAIETRRQFDGAGDPLPENHSWDAESRTLAHTDSENPHATLHVPFPARWAVQNTLRMGRTSRRGRGD